MRFTGDENIDKVFKNREFSMCETDRSYIAGKKVIKSSKKLFTNNKNFKFYNLYRKSLNDCLHCNYFEENIKKYPNNLFGEKTDKIANTPDLRVWIIKIGNYYYVLAITNIISVEESVKFKNKNEKKERNLYWKKMTQDELMGYSNGTYWKLIEQNNIRFN
jgi:long-subunit fatty acid transport protein